MLSRRRLLRGLAALFVLAVVIGLAALLFGYVRHNQTVVLPSPTGPHSVGRAIFDWVDESRPEVFTPDPSDRRELLAWVWYPVAAGAPTRPTLPYVPKYWQAVVDRGRGPLAAIATQNLAEVQVHAVDDGPVSPDQPRYPVVLLQPGLGPSHPDYTTLAEDLASRGYVVVGTSPTYSANVVVFPDARVAERVDSATVPDSASPSEAKAQLDKLIEVWAADNRFILDKLQVLDASDPDGRFTGRLDLNAIGMMGHSFGGASAAETCLLDARCKAGIDLDGSPYGTVIEKGLKQPFLFVWSEPGLAQRAAEEQSRQDVQTLVGHSTGRTYEVTIRGAHHFNFADYAVLYEPLFRPMQLLGSIDGARGLAITTAYVGAFFDQYLKGESQPLMAGPAAEYPEVEFVAH
jgi:predicted dienelactone hydrolase